MIANYHTHTWRCNHATGTEREYVENAIKGGLKILGFSDHTPMPYPNGFRCKNRMFLSQMDGYVDSLNIVPDSVISGMEFMPDIALAFIAFGTGKFFRIDGIRENGRKTIVITLMESFLSSLMVSLVTYKVLRLTLPFSLVLGALAAATAPASTMMTIRQTKAKGDSVNTLLQVIALDDIVGLVLYSVAISASVTAAAGSRLMILAVFDPVVENLVVMGLGGAVWISPGPPCKV